MKPPPGFFPCPGAKKRVGFADRRADMHELGITRNIVAIAREHACGRPVKRVALQIGRLAAVEPDAIRFCFDLCARDTELDGARLDIAEVPGTFRCRDCGAEVRSADWFGSCPCGSVHLECTGGQELKVVELELD